MGVSNKQKIISANNLIIAENERKVYDAGYEKGKAEGGDTTAAYEQGVADGKQAEYEAFWNNLQQNGNRTDYACTFGAGWNDSIFKPIYDMHVSSGYMMFRSAGITDLKNIPVKLDFSNVTNAQYMFQWAKTKYIGEVNLTSIPGDSSTAQMFAYSAFITIEKLVFKDDGTQAINSNMFTYASALENLTIEGIVGKNFNLQWSTKLSKASIESIIFALDLTEGRPATTVTLSLVAVNKAFETIEGANDGASSGEFSNLCASARVAGWTISLV